MFSKLSGFFSKKMGVDLGSVNTRMYIKDRGIVVNQPTLVVVNTRMNQVIAQGFAAKKMLGKAPNYMNIIKPLEHGVITDFEVTEKMLRASIEKIQTSSFFLLRAEAIVSVPLDITEVEKKSFEDAVSQAGARKIYLVERPMAAAIGMRLPVSESIGSIVAEIGGGLTEIAVIALSGIVAWKSLRVGGETWSEDIKKYVREKTNLLLGEQTVEEIKLKIGSVFAEKENQEIKVKGRDLITGLPKEASLSQAEVKEAILPTVNLIIEAISDTIEKTPPELVADVLDRGIILSGGGSMLKGLAQLINKKIKIPVHLTDDPTTSVVRGLGLILEDFDNLKEVLLPTTKD